MATIDYAWKVYTDNQGNEYSVKVSTQYGNAAVCDFGAYDATKPTLPKGMKMRFVYIYDPATGNTRKAPCGSLTADLFATPGTTISLPTLGSATATVWSRGRPINEWEAIVKPIHNL